MVQACLFQDFVAVDVLQSLILEHLCWPAQRYVTRIACSCNIVWWIQLILICSTCLWDGIPCFFYCPSETFIHSCSLLSLQNCCPIMFIIHDSLTICYIGWHKTKGVDLFLIPFFCVSSSPVFACLFKGC